MVLKPYIWFSILIYLQLYLESAESSLFMVDHIRNLTKAEYLLSLSMWINLRVIFALRTKRFNGYLFLVGTPYFDATASFTQSSQATIAFCNGRVLQTDSTILHFHVTRSLV
jgi:hypothetical protein